jgi:hypothetical protein
LHLLRSNDPSLGPSSGATQLPYTDAALRDARPAPDDAALRDVRPVFAEPALRDARPVFARGTLLDAQPAPAAIALRDARPAPVAPAPAAPAPAPAPAAPVAPAPAARARRDARPAYTYGVFGDLLPASVATAASAAASVDASSATAPAEAFDTRARIAGLLLLQCGMMLLLALVSRSWFTGPGGELGVLGIEECRGAVCHTLPWLDAKDAAVELQALSVTALLGGLVAVGFLLQAGVVLLTRRPGPRMVRGLGISLGVAALGIAAFFALLGAGAHARGVQVSWGGVLAIATVIGAAILLVTLVRPLSRAAAP